MHAAYEDEYEDARRQADSVSGQRGGGARRLTFCKLTAGLFTVGRCRRSDEEPEETNAAEPDDSDYDPNKEAKKEVGGRGAAQGGSEAR